MRGKLRLLFTIPLAGFIFLAYTSGPPAGYTGSPGDNGNYCTSCHARATTYQVSAQVITDIPSDGYTPGQTYQLTLQANTTSNKVGFQMTAENAQHQKTGTFSGLDGNTQILNGGQYIEHTSAGTGVRQWNIRWQAPNPGQGAVTFYAAINATNGDNTSNGDTPALFNWTVNENTTAVGKNTISGLSFYPNPVHDALYLKGNFRIEIMDIYDLKGQRILHFVEPVFPVSLESLDAGTYIIKVKTEGKSGSYVILKQ